MTTIKFTLSNGRSKVKVAKQMRFAASRALNDSAFVARQDLAATVANKFELRNTWTTRGFRVVKATKSRMVAKVGTLRPYLVDHVGGGTRKDKAVPTRNIRRRRKQIVRRARWPGKLIGKKRYVFLDTISDREQIPTTHRRLRSGPRRRVVFWRRGRGKKTRLSLLWVIPAKIRVKRRLPFQHIAQAAHHRTYPLALEKRLDEALMTAR